MSRKPISYGLVHEFMLKLEGAGVRPGDLVSCSRDVGLCQEVVGMIRKKHPLALPFDPPVSHIVSGQKHFTGREMTEDSVLYGVSIGRFHDMFARDFLGVEENDVKRKTLKVRSWKSKDHEEPDIVLEWLTPANAEVQLVHVLNFLRSAKPEERFSFWVRNIEGILRYVTVNCYKGQWQFRSGKHTEYNYPIGNWIKVVSG